MAGAFSAIEALAQLAPELRAMGARYLKAFDAKQITRAEFDGFMEALQKQAPSSIAPEQLQQRGQALGSERFTAAADKFRGKQVHIKDFIEQSGMPREAAHAWLLEQAKTGKVTVHPDTAERTSLSGQDRQPIRDAALTIPGQPEPFISVYFKPAVAGAAAVGGATLASGEGKAAQWPGQPAQAQKWPGQPAPNQQVQGRWPGQPASVTAPSQSTPSSGTSAPSATQSRTPETTVDPSYTGQVAEQWRSGVDAAKQGLFGKPQPGVGGALKNLRDTASGVAGVVQAASAPLTGAVRSFGGRAIQAGEQALYAGAEKLHGKERMERAGVKPPTFEEAAGQAEKLSMVAPGIGFGGRAPTTGLQAARNAMGTIEKIFSPETVDANAKAAAALIRERSGTAARATASTEAAIEPFWRTVNAMPEPDRLALIDYVEGRSTTHAGAALPPEQQTVADGLKTAFEDRMNRLQALPKHAQQAFIDDYFPHFWKEPGAAANVPPTQTGGGAGKQGSGASLKKRSIPTIADGIAQGLTPITNNPLEATMRYVNSMDRFIASEEVMQTAIDQGVIIWDRGNVMGASGHPQSFRTPQVPPGYEPLNGRGSVNAQGQRAYAPEGFARVFNNYISRGIAEVRPELGDAYNAARLTSNAITGLELSASGYHFLTVAKAALDNSMAQAIQLVRKGKPIEAVKQVAKTPLAPVRYAASGKKVKDVYLGLSPGTRELQDTVESLTKAGGRAVGGRKHAPEYEFSSQGSYVQAFKRGALRAQLTGDLGQMRASPVIGTARVALRHIGRAMDTVAGPLFEKYIPAVKNGAFRENLATWVKTHPQATPEETENAARQIWDSIDDRFGEMVQDNIFMNQLIKQIGMLSLRSWSWTVGQDVRMLAGGVRDVARAPFKKPTGTGPQDERWTGKMDMLIAMPIVYGTIAGVYQYLKTGQAPQDVQDLMAPRTGGVDATTGQPERLLLPGPEKDVFGFAEKPVDEAMNKRSTMLQQGSQLVQNRNWRDDPIFSSSEQAPPWLEQFWNYASESFGPISVRNLAKGRKTGSNVNRFEQMLGVREAPRYLTDPEGYEQMMKGIHGKQWRDKVRHEKRQQSFYGGD